MNHNETENLLRNIIITASVQQRKSVIVLNCFTVKRHLMPQSSGEYYRMTCFHKWMIRCYFCSCSNWKQKQEVAWERVHQAHVCPDLNLPWIFGLRLNSNLSAAHEQFEAVNIQGKNWLFFCKKLSAVFSHGLNIWRKQRRRLFSAQLPYLQCLCNSSSFPIQWFVIEISVAFSKIS